MNWPLTATLTLAAIGAIGVCLMVLAFVLIVRQGGWQPAIQQSIAEGRWPLPRRLLLFGASLALLFAAGMTILRIIPGGIPWREPPAGEQSESERATTGTPAVVVPQAPQRRSPPGDVSSFNEQPAPDFDPRLTLAWPGTPEESRRRIDPGTDRETTIYRASFNQDLPLTSFGATVYEFTEKDLQGGDPKEWLPRHLGAATSSS